MTRSLILSSCVAASFFLSSCGGGLSQEEAQQRIEKHLAANVAPPNRYEPLSTKLLSASDFHEKASPGGTWTLHRYAITDGQGVRQEREDTVIITTQDSIQFR